MHTQKKDRDLAKTKRVTVRMTETLYDVLETYAEKAGMTPVAYIRNLIVSKTPTVKYEIVYNSPEILRIFSDLGHISGNLNQIARHLNQGDTFTRELKQEVLGCISQILHIRDNVQEMVGEYRGHSETHSDS